MSQKAKIVGLRFKGAPVYLGLDQQGNPHWSANPERVMNWLCDGWRFRFNQMRAYRTKRKRLIDPDTGKDVWIDVPMGKDAEGTPPTNAQARSSSSFLTSMPTDIIGMSVRTENYTWFAALKRKKKSGGKVPQFRSRKRDPQFFNIARHGNKTGNGIYYQTGRNHGYVAITGTNPGTTNKPGVKGKRWKLIIKVRGVKKIRTYSSVNVNWTKHTLSFTNAPLPVKRTPTGSVIGIDRGVAHTLTTSDGQFIDITTEKPGDQERYKSLQRKMARQRRVNDRLHDKHKWHSNRYDATKAKAARIAERQRNRRKDWVEKTTTSLVRDHDYIAVEDLKVANMTRRAHGSGRAAKAGLNRAILKQNWSEFLTRLEFKAELAGVKVVKVPPQYTSQTCSECGCVARENRESQAVFVCKQCGHAENADVNAAKNILSLGLGNSLGRGGMVRPDGTQVLEGAPGEALTRAPICDTVSSVADRHETQNS